MSVLVRVAIIWVVLMTVSTLVKPSAQAGIPTPSVPALQPMQPVTADAMREVRNASIVDDGSGPRRAGVVEVLAKDTFNTGFIRSLDTTAELIEDLPPDSLGIRIILIRAADAGLDRLIAGIRAHPSVVASSKSFIAHGDQSAPPNDPSWSAQNNAGLGLLDLTKLWTLSTGKPGVRVAVIDSGVSEIPDLSGRVQGGLNFLATPPSSDTSDDVGHGTLVASVIGASANNGIGIARHRTQRHDRPGEGVPAGSLQPSPEYCLRSTRGHPWLAMGY